jgi:hypothetical protein
MASNFAFNFTKSGAGFTMPSTTPVDTDPNSNPLEFFKNIKKLQDSKMGGLTTLDFANSPVYCLFDHSGSNAECAGLMKLIAHAILTANSDTSIIPFGSDRSHEFKQFPAAMYNPTRTSCQWMTNTNFISLFFTQIVGRQTTPFTLVFLGDGDFSDSNFIRIIRDAALVGILDYCKHLIILFSPHTSSSTMATLTTELTQICAQTRNVIPIQCHRLGNRDRLLPADNTIITAIGKVSSVKLPTGWVRVGDWAMHEKLSMKSLIQVLSNNKPAADELLALIQQNASINPGLLNSHPIYGLLYRTLCHQSLYGKEMNAWMNKVLTDKTTTPDNRKILQQLLDTSRATAAKDAIAAKLDTLIKSGALIGFQKCADGAFSAKDVTDIREAIKGMDFAAIIRFATQIVKTAQHQIISVRDVQPGDIIGIPILNSKKATQNDCLQALSLMFAQFAEDLVVNGLLLYCAALGMLFSDTAVSGLMHSQIERALFDNQFATLTNLGIRTCPKTGTVSWDEDTHLRVMQPAVCGLLARAYTHFGDRLFPGVDFSNRQGDGSTNPAPEHMLAVAAYYEVLSGARAYTINRFINKLLADHAYLVRGKFSFGLFPGKHIMWSRNIICAFKPFAKDPQPNLPSLGYTIGAVGKTRWQLEYLDRPLGTDDTVTLGLGNLIPLFDLSGMPSAQRDTVLMQFNQWLHKSQQDGARGLLGDEMLMNTNQTPEKGRLAEFPVPSQHITHNQELYDANMRAAIAKMCELITDTGLSPAVYQIGGYSPIVRPLTRSEAVSIIADMAALTPEAIQIYTRGNNLNAADLAIAKARNPNAIQRIPAGIPADLIALVRADFGKAMVPPPLPHLQVGTTSICMCCLDTLANRHMVKLACAHDLCNACHDVMVGYLPTPGEPVNMAMCRCPACQTTLPLRDPALLVALQAPTTNAANNSVLLRCRIPDCTTPYYCEALICGATADTLPKLCSRHRPKEEHIKVTTCPNPSCCASLTRDSGCDVVRCHCHQALCFGCGAPLPSSTVHWECHGSRSECDAAVAHRATDPDNWSDGEEDW